MDEQSSPAPARDFQQRVIDEFRANDGIVGGPFQGSSLLLLTTVGARTRRRHTTPLGYLDVDDTRLVVASAGGADRDPAWLHNLRAHPVATVEVGSQTYPAIASVLTGAGRERFWDEVVRRHPGYGDYQRATSRVIPLVEVRPLPARDGVDRVRGMGDFLREAHRWLSEELDLVLAQVDTLVATADAATSAPPATPTPLTGRAQVRERCLTFCGGLERHHLGEDRGGFPMLAERFPALEPVLAQLRAEHGVVAEINTSIRDLLEAYTPGAGDPLELRATLHGLVARLHEHFAYEEATILDALDAIADAPPSGPATGPGPGPGAR